MTSPISYFGSWDPPKGLNADLERHDIQRAELQSRIDELEAIENRNDMQERCLKSYYCFHAQLMNSRDIVASKIGRKG